MKLLDWLDRVLVVIAVSALVVLTVLITVSMTGRYLIAAPIPDDLVMSEFLMVFVVFLPLSAVQAAREHVFVTIFTEWMSNRAKVIMEAIGLVVGFFIFSLIAVAAFTDFYQAWEVGSYIESQLTLPEWPARFVVAFGLGVFAVRLLLDMVMALVGLARGTALATRSEEARALEAEVR